MTLSRAVHTGKILHIGYNSYQNNPASFEAGLQGTNPISP